MIYKGDKEVRLIYYGEKAVKAVYYGIKLVWKSVRSCFGGGGWDNNLPWDNNDGWRN